ncbi:MAG: hypothetical protein N2645_03540 [Clostridia bacterium]|nr:hypothetical protein [Clostridia bacterium]
MKKNKNPKELTLKGEIWLSEIAKEYGLILKGSDVKLKNLGTLLHKTVFEKQKLTYANTQGFLQEFLKSETKSCIIPSSLYLESIPEGRSFLLTERHPEDDFFIIFSDLAEREKWNTLEASQGINNVISKSATIYPNVVIGDNCCIMDHVVLLPNTCIGNNVTIKPNSVIGGDGFHVRPVRGIRSIIKHTGGVWIEDHVEIGSCCSIDKGMCGDFTTLGEGTKIDNIVHVAHSVTIGSNSSIAAGTEVSGCVSVGDHVWIGPRCAVVHGVAIGEYSHIVLGSMVGQSMPAYSFVSPIPSRRIDWVCKCKRKLDFVEGFASCSTCNLQYELKGNQIRMI